LDAAEACFGFAVEQRYLFEMKPAVDSCAGWALSRQLSGKVDGASEAVSLLESYVAEIDQRGFMSAAHAVHARINLLRGDLVAAIERSRLIVDQPSPSGLFIWLEVPSMTRARVLLASGTKARLAEAVVTLRRLRQMAEDLHFTGHLVETSVLLAVALERQEESTEADRVLGDALTTAEPGNWLRCFVEAGPLVLKLLGRIPDGTVSPVFVGRVRDAVQKAWPTPSAPASQSLTNQQLIDPLTNRELDVLELLLERLQDKELAERLNVSNQTVKTHLKHIYQKLAVNGRQAAVRKAAELGLV
jgi:LuxR family maltose regulon positive regulatory protein